MDKITNKSTNIINRKKQENFQGNAEGFGSPNEISPYLQQLRNQHGFIESKNNKAIGDYKDCENQEEAGSSGSTSEIGTSLQQLRNLHYRFSASKNDVELIEDSKNRKWEGEQDSDGVFIKNFLRLQENVDEIRKAKGSIFIVSNRGPMGYKRESDEAEVFEEVYGAGGVSVALRSIKKRTKGLARFLSMPMERGDRAAQAAMEKLGYVPLKEKENNGSSNKNDRGSLSYRSFSMNDIEQRGIKLEENVVNEFVADKDITEEDFENYYNKFCNIFLWLSFHGMHECILESDVGIKSWEGYSKVNQAFANKLSKMIEKDQEQGKKPIVMLNDYHLLHVSSMLRKEHPNIVLQHFIHIPWPEPQNLRDEPWKIVKGIYEGLSGNDIIGFQTEKDATNFLKGVLHFLPEAEVNLNESTVRWKNGQNTRVRVYPISIDVDKTRKMAKVTNRESVKEMKKIMSAGRMDLIKNDVRVLESYGWMLDHHPNIHRKVIFTPRLVPSRQGVEIYKNLQKEVKRAIAEINKKYSTDSWMPIIPDYGNDHKDALRKMVDADVVVVGSLADGMNLVALEAASIMEQGILVLSAKAGAHELLKEGVLSVNDPRNTQEMADRLYEALMMSPGERRSKTAIARKTVEKNDLLQWQCKQFSDICGVLKSK